MKRAILLVAATLISGTALSQTRPATPKGHSLDALREKRRNLQEQIANHLTVWWNLNRRRIAVVRIKGLAETKGTLKEKLDARFLALAKKRASNRQWKTYWSRQYDLAAKTQRLYSALLQLIPLERAQLKQRDAETNSALVAAIKRQGAAKHQIDAIKKQIAERHATLVREKALLDQAVAAAQQKVLENTEALKKADAALELAKKATDPAPLAKAKAEKARVEKQLAADKEALKLATTKRDTAETALQTVVAYQTGNLTDANKVLDEPFRKASLALTVAEQALKTATETQHQLAAALKLFGKRRRLLLAQEKLIRPRLNVLYHWSQLAGHPKRRPSSADAKKGHTKVANQDRYFDAINEDITAVRLRLRELRKEALSKQQIPTKDAKKKPVKSNGNHDLRSPLARYRANLAKLRDLKSLRQIDIDAARADLKMVTLQLKATELLVEAQKIDVQLVNREVKIASSEFDRCNSASWEPKKSDTWYAIWTALSGNAATKVPTLYTEQVTSEATREILSSYAESHQQDLELLNRELKRVSAELEREDGRFRSVLWSSFLYWLRKHAWFIPLVFIGAWILLIVARRIANIILNKAQTDADMTKDKLQQVETLVSVGASVVKLVIYVVAVILTLHLIGVNVGPILGGAAIFGLAISFGSQNLVRDVVTGFFILLENQYAIGDVIEVNGTAGAVEAITLRRTVIRDLAGTQHTIPNGAISKVSNQTQGWARAVVHVGVSYSADLEHVKMVSNAVGEAMFADSEWSDKLLEAPTFVGVTELADSAVMVRVMAKTEIFHQWSTQRELTRRLKEAFDMAQIEIPFPQRSVHLVQPPAADAKPTDPTA